MNSEVTLGMLVLIFVSELCVVTLGTLRIIFIARGSRVYAPILGFFEITLWLYAMGQIMQNLSHFGCYLAFAAGYTTGNLLGIVIETKLAIGTLVVRTITRRPADDLVQRLRQAAYGVTTIDAKGATGPVQIVFTVIKRRELAKVVQIITDFDPRAFYSVDDLRSASEGISPATPTSSRDLSAVLAQQLHVGQDAPKRMATNICDVARHD